MTTGLRTSGGCAIRAASPEWGILETGGIMDIWTIVKWGMIIWLGPHALSFLLRFGALGAVYLADWLDKWPL
jgi:hypothetical protein